MNKNNQVVNKPKFSVAIQTKGYQQLINKTLNDPKRANRFVASIMSAVSANPALQECDAGSILSSALLGESLELSPSPQLGQFYLVPFNKKNVGKVATFILGYKGYIQLAIRSGNYKKINVLAIKEGELVRFDPLSEEIEVNLIEDEFERDAAETTGYYAMFEYHNGFKKALYWHKSKMILHADRYSPAFRKDSYRLLQEGKIPSKDLWKYSSFWYKSFDDMATKTMLRQLLSKWGILSIQMQEAYLKDDKIINENGEPEIVIPEEPEEPKESKQEEKPPIETVEAEEFTDEIPEALKFEDLE